MNRLKLLACLASVVALGPFWTQAQAQETPTVRYQVFGKTIIHLPSWVMQEQGFCEKHGIKCEAITLNNAPLALSAAAAGSVDIVNATIDTALPAIEKGNDLQIVGATVQSNPYVLVYRSDLSEADGAAAYPSVMSSIKDKKVGVASRGSSTELFLRLLLAGAGLKADDVTYVPVGGPGTAFAALAAKQIDAAVTWDPAPALCKVTEVCRLLVDMRVGEGPASFQKTLGTAGYWVATRSYVEKHPERVDAFNRAQIDAVAWINDPQNAAEVLEIVKSNIALGPNIGNPEAAYQVMIDETVPHLTAQISPPSVADWQEFLLDNGLVQQGRPVEDVLYKNAPLRQPDQDSGASS